MHSNAVGVDAVIAIAAYMRSLIDDMYIVTSLCHLAGMNSASKTGSNNQYLHVGDI